ncbi:hypothetical protein FCOIX_5951 [Fusarium coicis]|nr:hypothetical protein FCOIX_5951 [Fusarium coicis]
MAAPEPETTPATAIDVADEEDAMIFSDDDVNYLAQLATKIFELRQTVMELEERLKADMEKQNELQQNDIYREESLKTAMEQHNIIKERMKMIEEELKTIQQLVEHQGASQIAEDDNETEN